MVLQAVGVPLHTGFVHEQPSCRTQPLSPNSSQELADPVQSSNGGMSDQTQPSWLAQLSRSLNSSQLEGEPEHSPGCHWHPSSALQVLDVVDAPQAVAVPLQLAPPVPPPAPPLPFDTHFMVEQSTISLASVHDLY
jgi:hypothetical protein